MKHPQHDLLIAAANDKDARFYCPEWNNGCHVPIQPVIMYQDFDWKLVDKFAELKKAHAEGKQFQYKDVLGNWIDTIWEPQWNPNRAYRIKPEPVYEWQWLCISADGIYFTSSYRKSKEDITFGFNSKVVYRIEESKREVR